MIALIDLDSLIYKAKYKIEETSIIESLSSVLTNERLQDEIISQSLHRLENMYLSILEEVEETGIVINQIEFYLTTCKNSFRKKLDPEYKKDRVIDPLRYKITEKFVEETDFAFCHDKLEADDLIANRINELEESEYIIIAMDKDVLSLRGLHYNYYRPNSKPNEPIKPMIGLGHSDKQEQNKFLAKQMLMGDSCDGVKGISGIGKKKAEKILHEKTTDYQLFLTVVKEYLKKGISKDRIITNYKLLKLGD